jgi:HEAT repeat protein
VVAGLKDKSSAEPLRQFIMDVERRKTDIERLPRMEGAALGMASMTALAAYGELDGDSSVSVKFLSSMLNHDQPMEWSGGVAHSALANKGRPGLQALLEEARQPLKDDDRQISFLGSAIGEIKDPQFAVDLYVASKDPKCHKMVRNRAVFSLGAMAKQSSKAEQLLINLAEDEKFDQRSLAVQEVGKLNTPRALGVLLKLEKSSFNDTNTLQKALLDCDATNCMPIVFESILSPKTPRAEKGRLWGMLESYYGNELQPYQTQLRECLKVSDTNGVPINDLRVQAWRKLFRLTKNYNPVELDYNNEEHFRVVASDIIDEVYRRVYSKYRDAGKHSDAQMQQMALDEVKTFVTKWEAPKRKDNL